MLTGIVYEVDGALWFPCKTGFREERSLLHEECTEHLKLLVFTFQLEAQLLGAYGSVCPGVGMG